jgi:hypothetical protein
MTPEFVGLGQEWIVWDDETEETISQIKLDRSRQIVVGRGFHRKGASTDVLVAVSQWSGRQPTDKWDASDGTSASSSSSTRLERGRGGM